MLLSNELDEFKQEEGIGRGTNSSILCQYASANNGEDKSVIIVGDELVNGCTNCRKETLIPQRISSSCSYL